MADEATETAQAVQPAQQPTAQERVPVPTQTQVSGEKAQAAEKKYTDAEIDAIVERKFKAWSEKKNREISEAQRLAEMNAQQKAEYERDRANKELAELRRMNAMTEMEKAAREMLAAKDVRVSDAVLTALVREDAQTTKAAVDGFAEAFSAAVEKAVADKLRTTAPRAGAGKPTLTREQIMAIKDTQARQSAIRENIQLFE